MEKENEKTKNTFDNVFDHYEINILKENDVIESFDVKYGVKSFKHDGKQYNIDNDKVYFTPKIEKKETIYTPSLFYKYNSINPLDIKNKNKGIPARALYLLWNHALYSVIVTFETDKTNKLIILLLAINGILFGIRLYFMLKG